VLGADVKEIKEDVKEIKEDVKIHTGRFKELDGQNKIKSFFITNWWRILGFGLAITITMYQIHVDNLLLLIKK